MEAGNEVARHGQAVRQQHGTRQYGHVGVTKTWMLTGLAQLGKLGWAWRRSAKAAAAHQADIPDQRAELIARRDAEETHAVVGRGALAHHSDGRNLVDAVGPATSLSATKSRISR